MTRIALTGAPLSCRRSGSPCTWKHMEAVASANGEFFTARTDTARTDIGLFRYDDGGFGGFPGYGGWRRGAREERRMYESESVGEAGVQRPIDRSRHPIASGFPVALGDDATRPRSAHCGERRYGNIWRLRHGGQSRPLRSRYAAFDLTGSSHRPSGRSDSASSVRPLLPRRLLRLAPRVRAVSIRFLPRGTSAGPVTRGPCVPWWRSPAGSAMSGRWRGGGGSGPEARGIGAA